MHRQFDAVMMIDELADYLMIIKSTPYNLIRRSEVPGAKIGRHWRFHQQVIDRWLDEWAPGRNDSMGKSV